MTLRRLISNSLPVAVMVLLLALAPGCSREKSLTTAVHGTVTYKGQPLSGGVIAFHPVKVDSGFPARTAQGSIDTDGRYALSTFKLDDGAVPGDYAVTVFNPPAQAPIDEYSKAAVESPKAVIISPIYGDAQRTPLKATVPGPPSGEQQIDFALKD